MTAALALAAKHLGYSVDSAFVGLALSYALSITNTLGWMVMTGTSTEAEMSRVERILHYAAIPAEAPLETEQGSIFAEVVTAPEWPQTGRVDFQCAVMTYRPSLPPVRPPTLQSEISRPDRLLFPLSVRAGIEGSQLLDQRQGKDRSMRENRSR